MSNYDFQHWQSVWDKAVKENLLGSQTPVKPVNQDKDFEHDDAYWNYMDNQEGLLHEDERTANPIYPDTVGKDQDQPKPAWVREDLLKVVESLKLQLHSIEDKLNKEDGGNGKWVEKCHHPQDKKILERIVSLKKEIDKVSNELGLEFEPAASLYRVKG